MAESVTSYTVMVCTAALRADTNNLWRALTSVQGIKYDASPVNSLPGTMGIPLAQALAATEPWKTAPTHWSAGTWEFPDFKDLMGQLKAGTIDVPDWSLFNLTRQRARAAAQGLYLKTTDDDGREPHVIVAETFDAALTELSLFRIPPPPMPGG